MNDIYEPIKTKIAFWCDYDKNAPKSKYEDDPQEHDKYRSEHDLDCILNDGNLFADTIFSLWLPLRTILVRINSYTKLNRVGNINNKISFLNKLMEVDNLNQYLPRDDKRAILLSELFEIGQTKANTMILPNRKLQEKGDEPVYDYMPHFLAECFQKGRFSYAFKDDEAFKRWINDQKLTMFFKDEIIDINHIKDLSGSKNVRCNIPPEGKETLMLENYIQILKERERQIDVG
ncbi:hypothetical protein SAMN02910413_1278 [Pseudobutyrivibrio sp. C4]|uniref:hypothetical protein n=1 Tax=Pseudobutyrivibrio sp. C4 TaxID=1520803 RepID=UPI0008CE801A|nr:hypothetical protein [Pseudobutyrivibrio sp. C4]SES92519.1 hypothetical protein SAMN02910413_1278 [Pseudobutyrivibrio sp. C4]